MPKDVVDSVKYVRANYPKINTDKVIIIGADIGASAGAIASMSLKYPPEKLILISPMFEFKGLRMPVSSPKFNDTKNAKESHRVDLFSTTPYSIVVDLAGEAVDVRFPKLRENRKYRVAMADYIGKTYEKIEGDNHTEHDLLVVDLIEDYVKKHTPIQADNRAKQQIIKK